jgi:hypothetical protein
MLDCLFVLLSLVLGSLVMPHGAARRGTQHPVMSRHVASDTAHGRALQTTRRARINRNQRRRQRHKHCSRGQNYLHHDPFR